MTHVLLLSIASLPHEDLDTPMLSHALTGLGIENSTVNWSEPGSWPAGADLAVIRTTWDYTSRLDEFLSAMQALPMPLANSAAVVRWNSHKGYLVELAESGVSVVPSVLVRQGEPAVLPRVDAAQLILKPASSAGGRGVGLFAPDAPGAIEHLTALLARGDALVQPFEASVSAGERSLIFFGGRYSHAVRKVPAESDFRVQPRYGGRLLAHTATQAELSTARTALSCVDADLLYARVDLIGPPGEPLVMELELIEPEIFLPMADGAADRFAGAIMARLG